MVAETIKGLPPFFREKMLNIVVIVRARPTLAQEKKYGKGLLGLYEGVPIADRGQDYSGAMPDKITIFKDSIETTFHKPEKIREELRHVVMHEIAHHFGISDAELKAKGIY